MSDTLVMVFAYAVFALGLLYAAGVALLTLGLARVRPGVRDEQPTVTVVIAAHNEESSIGACLESVARQDYPADKLAVIVASDRSTDGTVAAARSYASAIGALTVLDIAETPPGISPKKHALATAIGSATGEIIMQVDADCIVPPGWVAGMAARFEGDVGMVAGVAPYRKGPGLLNAFVRHEYLWNVLMSAGSIAWGMGSHASGRNLAYRRDVFERIGGYGDGARVLSGDDTLLLHHIRASKTATVATEPSPATHVYTDSPPTLRAFIRQRIRHMSTGRLFDLPLVILGAGVYLFHGCVLLSLLAGLFIEGLPLVFVAGYLLKLLIDISAATAVRRRFGLSADPLLFPLNEFLLIVYFTIFPLLGSIMPVRWKEPPDGAATS